MEVKSSVEEKRVKSTIIRRRAKADVPAPAEETAQASPASSSPEGTSPATPEAPVSGADVAPVKAPEASAEVKKDAASAPAAVKGPEEEVTETVAAKEKPRKVARKKTKDELEMEMFERAGGLIKAADLIESAPERLERVFKPDRSGKKKKVLAHKEFKKTEITTPKAAKRVLRIEGAITVSDLAHRMGVKVGDILKKIIGLGIMATINHSVDADTALLVAHDFGYEVENVAFTEESLLDKKTVDEEPGEKLPRSPIVTVMGHVDHGKTTLLDSIRKAQVATGEAGGITQHIGAYEVQLPKGSMTFIDTPGHEAFTAMRARGAKVTDIVILVVAADDGIMPQTVEAIHHAKAAEVPIIVAINKVDKPEADPARVERSLMEHGLVSEKFGGETILVPVSAKTGQGIDDLLEMVLLQSEVLQLKSNPNKKAVGTIIEARLDRGRGPVATVVVQEGTLRTGDQVVAGTAYGKVRLLIDDQGKNLTQAGPSKPVEVLGLSGVPLAGDTLHAMDSEDDARQVAEHRAQKIRETRQQSQAPAARLEDMYAKAAHGDVPEVRIILKGDVQGSIEALRDSLTKLSVEKVRVAVLHAGVGAITESDVTLAVASHAIIVGFNMRPDAKARELADTNNIQIRTYNIIYDVIDDVKKAMEGKLSPILEEKYLGRAQVMQVFTLSKIGTIAGSQVSDGKIVRTASVRCLRDGKIVYEGKLSSLKRFKDDAREVNTGLECGIGIENFNDIKEGDVIEAFEIQKIAAKL